MNALEKNYLMAGGVLLPALGVLIIFSIIKDKKIMEGGVGAITSVVAGASLGYVATRQMIKKI